MKDHLTRFVEGVDPDAGDEVYASEQRRVGWNGRFATFRRVKVDRLTKTQIIIEAGARRFSRSNKRLIGDHSYDRPTLYPATEENRKLAKKWNDEWRAANAHRQLENKLTGLTYSDLEDLPLSVLQTAWAVLDGALKELAVQIIESEDRA